MKTLFEPSSNRNVGGHTGTDISIVWQEAGSASPRDHLEFGAKLLGFAGKVCDCGGLADELEEPAPPALAEETASAPQAKSPRAATLDVIYVSRAVKTDREDTGARGSEPPSDSIEGEHLVAIRIGYVSAAFEIALIGAWIIWLVRELPRTELDWGAGIAPALLILLALYGALFFVLDAVYGSFSGASRRAKKYMDQVCPPSKMLGM